MTGDPRWLRLVLALVAFAFLAGLALAAGALLVAYEFALAYFLGEWWTFGLGLVLPLCLALVAICYKALGE